MFSTTRWRMVLGQNANLGPGDCDVPDPFLIRRSGLQAQLDCDWMLVGAGSEFRALVFWFLKLLADGGAEHLRLSSALHSWLAMNPAD